jgi:hypothetical protein
VKVHGFFAAVPILRDVSSRAHGDLDALRLAPGAGSSSARGSAVGVRFQELAHVVGVESVRGRRRAEDREREEREPDVQDARAHLSRDVVSR